MAKDGSAPFRRPLAWQDPEFYDMTAIEDEMARVFDICHGCRRCFNLCESFPRLFDMIDATESGELDGVARTRYGEVVEVCTLCDMCFMTKCPYVPPHEFDLDFPHLMLRYRAADFVQGKVSMIDQALARTDRNGKLGSSVAPVANWALAQGNRLTRPVLEKVAGVDREAALPEYASPSFVKAAARATIEINEQAPAHGRKAVLYATCFVNYNDRETGEAAQRVLAHNGVETVVLHPECCGMPQFEQGNIADVAGRALRIAGQLRPWIEQGYRIVALVPSCALMLKFEWPLLFPENDDIALIARHSSDLSEYIVDIARNEGMTPGLAAIDGKIAIHIACHARAQNMGQKAAEMLRLIPDPDVTVVERCSGHGGSWGVKKAYFATALKVGKPVARSVAAAAADYIVSECPLAALHIVQGLERLEGGRLEGERLEGGDQPRPLPRRMNPVALLALAYGLT